MKKRNNLSSYQVSFFQIILKDNLIQVVTPLTPEVPISNPEDEILYFKLEKPTLTPN
jgi:hypothetical protein